MHHVLVLVVFSINLMVTDEEITEDNIIAICSKKLNDTQRRYSTYKKELYSIVYCLRQFHAYIWGHQKLVIVTDHMPLTYIRTSENSGTCIATMA